MRIVEQNHKILHMDDLSRIERAGRTCYKSEDKITDESAPNFARMLLKRGHTAMLEHGGATVHFTTNRGVTHELVRHRLASYGQESTRYVNYKSDHIEFICPAWCCPSLLGVHDYATWLMERHTSELPIEEQCFISACFGAENDYKNLTRLGWRPEQAREVLPNSLKTEIVVTTNYREWHHIFSLRAAGTTGKPHPQMQALMLPVLQEFAEKIPSVFGDLWEQVEGKR